jgi:hypothetical protein
LLKRIVSGFGVVAVLLPTMVLAMNDPVKVVRAWAQAAKERDGKKQYQLLCANQRNKNKAALVSLNWVTGVSSPSIGDYKITKLSEKRGSTVFLIKYKVTLQKKSVGIVSDKLFVKNRCITKFKYLSPTEGIPR